MKRRLMCNQNGGTFLILVIVLAIVAMIINSTMLSNVIETDETRQDVKRALAAIEASEELAIILRNAYDTAQAYSGSCPSGTSLSNINGVGFCISNSSAGRCIKNPLVPSTDLCLNSGQVQLSLYEDETLKKVESIAEREDEPRPANLAARIFSETAEAQVPNANLPTIPGSAPSLSFPAPSCPGDALCKTCSGSTVNKSMYCINMTLCLKGTCGAGQESYVQTIGLPHY